VKEGDLAPLAVGVVEDYREWLEHAGFTVQVAIPESAPPVRFDPAAVSQALVNLLDNAAKYSGASREIAATLAIRADAVVLEVQDHGVGIAADEQPRIFERFYRSRSRTGKGGYGLGLFMVRHIMDAHGGRAEVDSSPGRGSRFRLVDGGVQIRVLARWKISVLPVRRLSFAARSPPGRKASFTAVRSGSVACHIARRPLAGHLPVGNDRARPD